MRDEEYQIEVEGQLEADWSSWFDGMTITKQADGRTLISGPVRDQAALHGLLVKLRDMGMPILSLKRAAKSGDLQE